MLKVELKPKNAHPKQVRRNTYYNNMGKNNKHLLIMERGSEFGQNVTKTHLHKLNAEITFGSTCCSLPLS